MEFPLYFGSSIKISEDFPEFLGNSISSCNFPEVLGIAHPYDPSLVSREGWTVVTMRYYDEMKTIIKKKPSSYS